MFSDVFGLVFVWHRWFVLMCDAFPALGLGVWLIGLRLFDLVYS